MRYKLCSSTRIFDQLKLKLWADFKFVAGSTSTVLVQNKKAVLQNVKYNFDNYEVVEHGQYR